mmetsp:Transcript_17973/g.49852  ORF Transcript_17973/g.49852 Transcript_17973/m.49852 type:complete len:129 (-) Transcript_17973:182-568(-)
MRTNHRTDKSCGDVTTASSQTSSVAPYQLHNLSHQRCPTTQHRTVNRTCEHCVVSARMIHPCIMHPRPSSQCRPIARHAHGQNTCTQTHVFVLYHMSIPAYTQQQQQQHNSKQSATYTSFPVPHPQCQ